MIGAGAGAGKAPLIREFRDTVVVLRGVSAIPAMAHGGTIDFEPTDDRNTGRDIWLVWKFASVRLARAKYHDVNVALADGYAENPNDGNACVEHRSDGAIGIRYLNPERVEDGIVCPLRPEVLLYYPTDDGLRLAGVEYFELDTGQPYPSVFGQPYNGPHAGHEAGMPVHYDLHAWTWRTNPAALLADYSPDLSCPELPSWESLPQRAVI